MLEPTAALAEVTSLLKAVPDVGDDLEVAYVVGYLYWCRHLARDPGADGPDLLSALILFGLLYQEMPDSVPDPIRRIIEAGAGPVAQADVLNAMAGQAINLLNEALRTGDRAQLGQAISTLRQALAAAPADYPHKLALLTFLGVALSRRFERTGDPADANAAVTVTRQAARDCPASHPGHAEVLSNLGCALRARAQGGLGEPGDLDLAVSNLREAVEGTPAGDSDLPGMLLNLGTALMARADRTDALADFDEAITTTQDAVDLMPDDAPDRTGTLTNLAVALRTRFERTGKQADLEHAITILRELTRDRELSGDTETDAPGQGRALANLGQALLARFELSGAPADLDEALAAARQAAKITPADHPDHTVWLANIGLVLMFRYDRIGALADLDEAIAASRQAAAATAADNPQRARWLTNLGSGLARRSERTGALADLDEAISTARAAVAAIPGDHPDRARALSSLGAVLATRFERTGAPADLDEAISTARAAVAAIADDAPARAAMLANLGTALAKRAEWTDALADLDKAIAAMRDAVAATPEGHDDLAMWRSNLGTALAARSRQTGSLANLDESISTTRQAAEATPADDPDQAHWLANLADALYARFERTGSSADLDKAIIAGQRAESNGVASPRTRIRGARLWALAAASGERWPEAIAGFEAAIALIGLLAPRSLVHSDQEHLLTDLADLASDAAACCVRAGRKERAVELFEQGRGILLGQVLDTRTDLTALDAQHPDLGGRFAELREALDAAGERGGLLPIPPARTDRAASGGGAGLARLELERRRRLAGELDSVIEQIRATPEFNDFLRPQPVSKLATAAADGHVVIANVSRFGSHALILTAGDVLEPVPLDDLTPARVAEQVTSFLTAVQGIQDRPTTEPRITGVLEWLWDAIAGPVLERLGITGPPHKDQPWPRLWWCVPGLLSFLPLHAAGHHQTRSDPSPQTVTDRVVSSYAPTIRALSFSRRSSPADSAGTSGPTGTADRLVVVMPQTPDADNLPGALAEAELLSQRYGDRVVTLTGPEATHDSVTAALPGTRWTHFACHGHADVASPSASCLLLHDHLQRPLTVTDIAQLRLDADLAFLAACSTAHAGGQLPDEAIHLASAFQLAGYRHVIGTLWPTRDTFSKWLAGQIYAALDSTGTTGTAIALHEVTRRRRDKRPQAPSDWACHIHVGA